MLPKSEVIVHFQPLVNSRCTKATVQYIGHEGTITGQSAIDQDPETAEWKARELIEQMLFDDAFPESPP